MHEPIMIIFGNNVYGYWESKQS